MQALKFPPQQAALKNAVLNQTSFPAPGNITNAAYLTGDKGSGTNNCSFNANIMQVAAEGADAISPWQWSLVSN
jgi:hypothetical protein